MKLKLILLLLLSNYFTLVQAQNKPNILWIVCEDISPNLIMYGDSTANTPHLLALSKHSTIYTNAFATTGVCAPSRSAIITGMLPTSIGTMHMRTGWDTNSWGRRTYKEAILKGEGVNAVPASDISGKAIREYSAVIPANVKCFTEYLRAEGYYCTNNSKTDYQFAAPISAWDENDGKAHWRNRKSGQPFFSVFNINDTHESKLWVNSNLPLTVDPGKVIVPPYLPDNSIVRRDIARHYSNIEIMDQKVGDILDQLKKDGLYDETIVFFYSDHGGPLPHQKREIYEYGLKTPLMIKQVHSKTSTTTDRLISFVDLAPTVLSLAGIKPPIISDGIAFEGKYKGIARKYIFGTSDRFDEFSDRIRSVRNKQYRYIKNYHPELPKYKDVAYRKNSASMQNVLELKENNQLNVVQQSWFETKEKEELYDIIKDPNSLVNLVNNPAYAATLKELREQVYLQYEKKYDYGSIPESQLILQMWPNNIQPKTEAPTYTLKGNVLSIKCSTKGASLSYKISDSKDEQFKPDSKWALYTKPIQILTGKYVYIIANRIGFEDSEIVVVSK